MAGLCLVCGSTKPAFDMNSTCPPCRGYEFCDPQNRCSECIAWTDEVFQAYIVGSYASVANPSTGFTGFGTYVTPHGRPLEQADQVQNSALVFVTVTPSPIVELVSSLPVSSGTSLLTPRLELQT